MLVSVYIYHYSWNERYISLFCHQVLVMIPPHGEERMEVHAHWEEILLNKLKDIRFPSIRILNMAQVHSYFVIPIDRLKTFFHCKIYTRILFVLIVASIFNCFCDSD